MTYQPPPPAPVKGPFGPAAKVGICLIPVLTLSIFGLVPAMVLAARRKRRVDLVGAVAFAVLEMALFVCSYLSGQPHSGVPSGVVGIVIMLLVFGAPVHFLVMDSRSVWDSGRPQAVPAYPQPYGVYPPQSGYGYPPAPAPIFQAPPPAQAPVVHNTPPAQAQPEAAPTDDLQQLGELLRRQAGGDRQ
jgi:hypothetical protein